MTTIITQNRQHIITAEVIERISVEKSNEGNEIVAHTINGVEISLGIYKKAENAAKVMTYLSFCITDDGKTVVVPTEEVVSNDKKIATDFIGKVMEDIIKKGPPAGVKVEKVTIDPNLKEFLEKLKGGDKE